MHEKKIAGPAGDRTHDLLHAIGADSFIEAASASIVLWRFKREIGSDASMSLKAERKAASLIGMLFLALALVTSVSSVLRLATQGSPDTTLPGLVIAVLSLSFMFFLWSAKRKVGRALDSAAVMKDAACSMACIQLSAVLFCGSLLYILAPRLWWADAAAALLIAGFIAREGLGTVRAARSENFTGGCGCSGD